ncbi:MAG: hypothetical protein ACPL1Z_05890 [Candidatus Bathyarchaeales archaeon]
MYADRNALAEEHAKVSMAFLELAKEALERSETRREYAFTIAELSFKAVEHGLTHHILSKTKNPPPETHEDAGKAAKLLGREFQEGFMLLYDMYRRWSYRLKIGVVEKPEKPLNIAAKCLKMLGLKIENNS